MCGINHAYADPSDPCKASALEIALLAARDEVEENVGVLRVWRRRTYTAEAEVERLRFALKQCQNTGDEYVYKTAQAALDGVVVTPSPKRSSVPTR